MVKAFIKNLANVLLPPKTNRRKIAKNYALKLHLISARHPDPKYHKWFLSVEKREKTSQDGLKYRPLISVVVPAYNTKAQYLYPMIFSVVNQYYDSWELIIVNASDNEYLHNQIAGTDQIDTRIQVINAHTNKGISGNTNIGLEAARGDYVAFLDHDDLLTPNALLEMVKILQHQNWDIVYSDEDKVSDDGGFLYEPHFKPDWSPDLFRQVNYINHLTVMKLSLVKAVGYLDSSKDGAQDYDLLLRAIDHDVTIYHLPQVLYHWRSAKKSTASDFSTKQYVLKAGTNALQAHLQRNNIRGKVEPMPDRPGFYRVNYHTPYKASIFIYSKDPSKLLKLANQDATLEILTNQKIELQKMNLKHIASTSYSDFINKALKKAVGDVFIFINDYIHLDNPHMINELATVCKNQHTGVVAPMIIKKGSPRIVDAGIVNNIGKFARLFEGLPKNIHTYFGDTEWVRNVTSMSGLIFAVEKTKFDKFYNSDMVVNNQNFSPNFFQEFTDNNLYNVIWSFALATTNEYLPAVNLKSSRGSNYFNVNLEARHKKILLNKRRVK